MFPKNTKVLVVDDAELIRELVAKFFHELGYQDVHLSPDGEHAWALIQDENRRGRPFGLIISDFTMPKLDGFGLLRNVRGANATRDVPFILLTAESDRERVMTAIQLGVTQFVVKPFNLATLSEALKSAYHLITSPKAASVRKAR